MARVSQLRTVAVAALALLLAAAASDLGAQASAASLIPAPGAPLVAPAAISTNDATQPETAPVGPLLRQGVLDIPAPGEDEMNFRQGGRTDRNVRWMIVGGGLLLGGMIIGDDVGTVLSVTGLVIGSIGLYRYLQ